MTNKEMMEYSITFKWKVVDVLSLRPDLSAKDCVEVLDYAFENVDWNYGFSWNYLADCAETLFPLEG